MRSFIWSREGYTLRSPGLGKIVAPTAALLEWWGYENYWELFREIHRQLRFEASDVLLHQNMCGNRPRKRSAKSNKSQYGRMEAPPNGWLWENPIQIQGLQWIWELCEVLKIEKIGGRRGDNKRGIEWSQSEKRKQSNQYPSELPPKKEFFFRK